jgi:hypothetical protein
MEKLEKAKERSEERAANKREKEYWEQVKHNGWCVKLHDFIKASAQNPTLNLHTPQNLIVPPRGGHYESWITNHVRNNIGCLLLI